MSDYNTEIFKANLSDRNEIPQRMWTYDPHSCLRPNTEFDLPIICQVHYPNIGQRFSSQGVEFDTFQKCCPNTNSPHQINQWVQINTCELLVCFTDNETLAKGFDQCIYETAETKKEMINNTTSNTNGSYYGDHSFYSGRCEWIDFDNLKKGIRNVEDLDSSAPAKGLLLRLLLTTTLMAVLLGPAIG
ncbi:hypothetical protein F5B22DRAFT_613655 [Xylaria bambusicola]|uniref:uncharacterized protein n=1 Tax=Xylaria bambusicola TaxID=326684 RepID=UPI0020085460|nr:uncharacterized protein F5B22DRAFT_613655 [Xylaria bambusicola]KAI0512898.1 hypothetical protein F5B22DRAFT_613655 [Xylaria bambusicola]